MAFKNPDQLVKGWSPAKPSEYDREATINYLKQFGDGFTDDAYEEWAKKKGKTLAPRTPLNPDFAESSYAKQNYGNVGTYRDQYLNDDEWLENFWDTDWSDILEYKNNG